ncbi:hypothetical protein INO11_14745, partial [Staphylococcus aureus]|nr:hypothetical protein [Staphylococcus aureus]
PEINLCLEIGDFLNDWRDNGLEYRFDILGYWDDGLSHATNKIINIYYKNGENIKVNPGRYFSDQNLLAFLTKSGIISR